MSDTEGLRELNFPREQTQLRIALAAEERNRILRQHYGLDPLSQMDGTKNKYLIEMQKFFAAREGGPFTINQICEDWYSLVTPDWHGYVDWPKTGVSTGTRGGDAANLSCTPSTNTEAGRDDYAGNPLFACIDCNWTVDPDTLEPVITAIEGICGDFSRYDPEKFVGVLQHSAWDYWTEDENNMRYGYSSRRQIAEKAQPLPEACRVDGTVRSWMVHAKYPGHVKDGKWVCCSGWIPTTYTISYNTVHTISAATGDGISGTCYCDWDFLRKMMMIKYASLTMDGIIQGCVSNNKTAIAAASETGVKRILLPTDAPALEEGMGVLIGTTTATGTVDRTSASCYSISTREGCVITSVETVTLNGADFKAVYVDVDTPFDTESGTTCIATFHWRAGSCDNILGTDGSPKNPGSGVYPGKIQGIEFGHGALIVLSDVIMHYDLEDEQYYFEPYFVYRTAQQANTITDNYVASGVRNEQPNETKQMYIKHMKLTKQGVFIPDEYGGSSSTYYRDSNYVRAGTVGNYEVLVVGYLNNYTTHGGLSYANLYYGVSTATWGIASGPSPNGNRRGEWAA